MNTELGAFLEIDTKSLTDAGTFEGYASIFNKADLGKDVVRSGAFTNSLGLTPAAKVKMLRGHDASEPIGVWTGLAEDSKGLHAKGRLIMGVARARETHELMREGALDGLSIGFRTKRASFDRTTGLRHIEEADLKEISIVSFPMMPDALVTAVKGELDDAERARSIVAALNRATAALRSL